jgi:hypothetical protein
MATVNKNFRIKQGLVVEGSTGTIGGQNILTETGGDQYILNLIGGETLVKSVLGNLSVNSAGALSLNQNLLAGEMAGDYLFTNGDDNLNVDIEGIATDLINNANFATTGNISSAIADEVSRANIAYDTAGSASAAQANAEDYTDTALQSYTPTSSLDTTVGGYGYLKSADLAGYATETYADNAAAGALEDAQTYADAQIDDTLTSTVKTWSSYKTNAEISSAQTAAQDYADGLINDASNASDEVWSAYKTSTEIGLAQAAAEQHADEAVAALVGSAPELLDTIQELATALENNPDIIADLENVAAGKQNTLTAGANIDITADTISVTGLDTADVAEDASRLYFTDTRAKDAVASALGNGIEYSGTFDVQIGDGLSFGGGVTGNGIQIDRTTVDTWYDASGAAATAQENAEDYADSLAPNYDAVGSATLAQSAAEATALGYVADVLDGTTPFTDININDVAKQVASRATSLGSVAVTAYQFNKSAFKSGKFLVKIDNGTHNEISEILVTLDSSGNVAITEYAIVGTNGSRGTITADVDATHCRIRVTPVNDSTITVAGTIFNA